MVYLSHNSFDTQEHVLHVINIWVEVGYLQVRFFARISSFLKAVIRKFYDWFNDLVCPSHLSLSQMLSDMSNKNCYAVLCTDFDYWFRLLVHGGCDRSTGDAYSSEYLILHLVYPGICVCHILIFVFFFFWIKRLITFRFICLLIES